MIACSKLSLLGLLLLGAADAANKCTHVGKHGATYDLGPLTKKDGNDWTVEQTSGGETTALFLNICDVCTKTCGHTEPLAVAAFHKQGTTLNGCIPLGFIKEQKIEEIDPVKPDKGIKLKYKGGFQCVADSPPKTSQVSVTIEFTCKPEAGKGKPLAVMNTSPCDFKVEWPSAHGCPVGHDGVEGGSIGSGWWFVIAVFVGLSCYCGIGVYMNMQRGLQGAEAVPNADFWRELPGLVQDGVKFVQTGGKGSNPDEI